MKLRAKLSDRPPNRALWIRVRPTDRRFFLLMNTQHLYQTIFPINRNVVRVAFLPIPRDVYLSLSTTTALKYRAIPQALQSHCVARV